MGEEAQRVSYEAHEADKQGREMRDRRKFVEQGELEPLEERDPQLMQQVVDTIGGFDLLGETHNRALVWRYVRLKERATKWYKDHSKSYFSAKDEVLVRLLDEPDVAAGVQH